jgi:hypothetical protein
MSPGIANLSSLSLIVDGMQDLRQQYAKKVVEAGSRVEPVRPQVFVNSDDNHDVSRRMCGMVPAHRGFGDERQGWLLRRFLILEATRVSVMRRWRACTWSR